MKTEYFKHSFKLSKEQIKKIISAVKAKEEIRIHLTEDSFKDGNTELPLTKGEAGNVVKNKDFLYLLNKSKMKFLVINKTGGFLPIPLLLGILGGLATATTAGTAVAKTVLDKQANDEKLKEEQRHHLELEKAAKGEGMFLNPWKNGTSICVKEFAKSTRLDPIGQRTLRAFLKNLHENVKIEKYANGLYLSPYN